MEEVLTEDQMVHQKYHPKHVNQTCSPPTKQPPLQGVQVERRLPLRKFMKLDLHLELGNRKCLFMRLFDFHNIRSEHFFVCNMEASVDQ